MADASTTEHLQQELAAIADGFRRITRPKWEMLIPFKDSIAELRRRGASFKTIAIILRGQSIQVSHDTVGRFWHEAIRQEAPRKKRNRAPTRMQVRLVQSTGAPRANAFRRIAGDPGKSVPPGAAADKGPRIAETKDL